MFIASVPGHMVIFLGESIVGEISRQIFRQAQWAGDFSLGEKKFGEIDPITHFLYLADTQKQRNTHTLFSPTTLSPSIDRVCQYGQYQTEKREIKNLVRRKKGKCNSVY